ncbi:hypothetical protein P7C71_g800, partial [Lecanoromycetidae sp. Uapishka_2]
MLYSRAFLASTLALFANANPTTVDGVAVPTSISPAKQTKILNDLSAYQNSITAHAEWSSALAAYTSAIPSSVLTQIDANPIDYIQSVLSAGTPPAWVSAVPTSAVSYISSVVSAEASIISKDAKGPAPTNGAKIVGAVVAAGGAALALL